MRKKNPSIILIISLLFASVLFFTSCSRHLGKKNLLLKDWKFEYNDAWHSATVPGTIHTDLLSHNVIPDPFYRDNEQTVQWVSSQEWRYKTHFTKSDLSRYTHAELVFEGLDCIAMIYLNGKPLLHTAGTNRTDNMFRKWIFPLDINTLEKNNELIITFLPSVAYEEEMAQQWPYALPENRAFTRKAQYQSGWDWGPKLITCGIWKPVYIELWNEHRILDYQIYQKELTNEQAVLEIKTCLEINKSTDLTLSYFVNGTKVAEDQQKQLSAGEHYISQIITIPNPQKWYPNGMGKQPLYDISVKIEGNSSFDSATKKIGMRTIELIREKDSIGESFYFQINGEPFFAKGANWIPAHSFTTEVTPERYYRLIKSCKESNMNMIRVWGGGIYEDDLFYQYCNEMGILVWQDFMFAGAIYPDNPEFLDNIAQEAKEQVKRIRNHPCLALWCGNNEVKNAWEDWGWQKRYNEEEKRLISKSIDTIFNHLLAQIVRENDPERDYHPTSPLWGWGHPENFTEGDSHYWGVWWGEEPFEVWPEKTGRFMSEYGFQSYPELASVMSFTKMEDRTFNSPVMKVHQKHGRGMEIIAKAIEQYFGMADSFAEFLYRSQLTQAYGYTTAIEAHRLAMPYCMGSLYWQLNDCWPVASWSTIDYYERKKAAWFASKKAFQNVVITTGKMENGKLPVYIISDERNDIQASMEVTLYETSKLYDVNTLPKYHIKKEVTGKAKAVTLVDHINISKADLERQNDLVLYIVLKVNDSIVSEKLHYFSYPKHLRLLKPEIKVRFEEKEGHFQIKVVSNAVAKGVFLSTGEDVFGDFSDNYFDLLPHQEKIVTFTPHKKLEKPFFVISRGYTRQNY